MAPTSAAMELKVLISILQSGTALQTMLDQVNDLAASITKLQTQVNAGSAAGNLAGIGPAGQTAAQGINTTATAVTNLNPQLTALAALSTTVGNSIRFLAGGFLALRSVQFLKNIADAAARTEVLNTVLHIVALNAGVTEEKIDRIVQGVQRLGITAQAARESLTKFLQAGLKPEGAEGLARAAQDLAVISGRDSSETFRRLIVNIQQLDTMGLRFQGIIVNRMEANQKYKQAHAEITGELTRRQMQEALLAEVIDKARSLEGAYEAAMGNVGKQITSLTRYYQDLRSEIGKHLLPAYSAFIAELSLFLAKMQDQAILSAGNLDLAKQLGEAVRWMSRQFFDSIAFIVRHREALYALMGVYAAYWLLITRPWVGWIKSTYGALHFALLQVTQQTVAATTATYAWITALTMLGRVRQTQLAVAAGSTVYSAFDRFTTPPTNVATNVVNTGFFANMLLNMRKFLTESVIVQRMIISIRTGWATLVTGMRLGATVISSPLTGVVLTFGGFLALAMKYTSLGPVVTRTFGSLGTTLKEVGTLLTNVFLAGWKLVGNVFKDVATAAGGLERGLGTLWDVVDEMPDFLDPLAKWKTAFSDLGKFVDSFNKQLAEANRGMEQLFGLTTNQLERSFNRLTDELITARNKLADAAAANVAAIGNQAEMDRTKKIYDEANAAVKKLEGDRGKVIESLRVRDPKRAEFLIAQAARAERAAEAEQLATAAADAAGKMKVRVLEGKVEPTEFLEQLSGLDALIKQSNAVRLVSADRIAELRRKVPKTKAEEEDIAADILSAQNAAEDARIRAIEKSKELLPAVGPLGTAESFLERLGQMRAFATDKERADLDVMRRTAEVQAREYIAPIYVRELALQKADFENARALLKIHYEKELALIKSFNESREAEDQEALETGRMTREAFRARRIEDQEAEFAAERKIVEAALATARGGLQFAIKPEERLQAAREVVEAETAIRTTEEQQRVKRIGLDIAQRAEQRKFDERILDIRQKIAAEYGGEKEAIDVITERYRRLSNEIGVAGNIEAQNALRMEEMSEKFKVHTEFRGRRLELEMDALETIRAYMSVQQALLDIEQQRIEVLAATGAITDRQAMELRNAERLKQIELDRGVLASKKAELDRKTLEYQERVEEFAAFTRELDPTTLFRPDDMNTLYQIVTQLGALKKELEALQLTVTKTSGELDLAISKMEFYGKQVKDRFVDSFADAFAQTLTNFRGFGEAWINMTKAITNEIANIIGRNLAQRLSKMMGLEKGINAFFDAIFGGRGKSLVSTYFAGAPNALGQITAGASGGLVVGPGTGTSDSIPAMLSAGEHVMPAAKAAQWLPLLEGIRLGRLAPAFALGGVVSLQSIALSPVIPRRYATGGVVVSDGGASTVTPGGGGNGNMVVSLHPDAMNQTMREWLEHEVVRQRGRR